MGNKVLIPIRLRGNTFSHPHHTALGEKSPRAEKPTLIWNSIHEMRGRARSADERYDWTRTLYTWKKDYTLKDDGGTFFPLGKPLLSKMQRHVTKPAENLELTAVLHA